MKEKKIVFICTGNTCRSPMAEGIFNSLASQLDVRAVSCGVSADIKLPASSGAQNAAMKYGVDLSRHVSTPASGELLRDATAIYCMTSRHRQMVIARFPELSHLVYTLGSDDISDPFGGTIDDYERTAEQIYDCIVKLIDKYRSK